MQYIDDICDRLGAVLLAVMRLSRDVQMISVAQNGRELDTSMGSWKKH